MRREEIHEQSKEEILHAAIAEFGENGYSAARISNICQNHHISKGKLFHYYRSKEELFLICVEKCVIELSDWLQNIRVVGNTFEERLYNCYQAKFRFFMRNPRFDQIFFDAAFHPPQDLREDIAIRMQPFYSAYRRTVGQVLEDTVFKPNVDVNDVVDLIFILSNNNHTKFKRYDPHSNVSIADETEEQCKKFIAQVQLLLSGAANNENH